MENLSAPITKEMIWPKLDVAEKGRSPLLEEICLRTGVFELVDGKLGGLLPALSVDLQKNEVECYATDLFGRISIEKYQEKEGGLCVIKKYTYKGPFVLIDKKYNLEFYRFQP